jgi:hypothetical protein
MLSQLHSHGRLVTLRRNGWSIGIKLDRHILWRRAQCSWRWGKFVIDWVRIRWERPRLLRFALLTVLILAALVVTGCVMWLDGDNRQLALAWTFTSLLGASAASWWLIGADAYDDGWEYDELASIALLSRLGVDAQDGSRGPEAIKTYTAGARISGAKSRVALLPRLLHFWSQ